MNLLCQLLAFSAISLSFATLLFKQYHYRNGEEDKWFYISINQFVTFDELTLSGLTGSLCNRLTGWTLAQPQSTEETEVINNGVVVVSEIQEQAGYGSTEHVNAVWHFYINVHAQEQEDNWKTINGTEVTHFDWRPSEPDNSLSLERCVMISGLPQHQDFRPLVWRDVRCHTTKGYVCEISVTMMNFQKMGREFECGTRFCPSTGMEKTGISQLRCARLCNQNSSCRGIKFYLNTQTCVLAVDGSEFDLDAAIEEETVCCMKI